MAARHAWLRCVECNAEELLGPPFEGCARCATRGRAASLEVRYDYTRINRSEPFARAGSGDGLWRFRALLPLDPDGALPITLQEGQTPLLALPGDGPGRIWLKDEIGQRGEHVIALFHPLDDPAG